MKVAAIFPIGTSIGGCPAAIAEILKSESALEVYLIFGKRAAMDADDPADTVMRIKESIRDERVTWRDCVAVDAHKFAQTYEQTRAAIARIAEENYDRIYVGITGGTNPMVAALFQAAAYLPSQLIDIYVQSRAEDRVGIFVGSEVRDRATAEDVIAAAHNGQIRIAERLAQRLPSADSRWSFLRESLTALSYWDDFDYAQASQPLAHQARKCPSYASDPLLALTADTVARISCHASKVSAFTREIRDVQNFGARASSSDWSQHVEDMGVFLVADVLANADRRLTEARFTDSVLRSYRAAECATQMRLLQIGIHPSQPMAYEPAYRRCCTAGGAEVGELAFRAGLELLQLVAQFDLASIEQYVRNLANVRNHTYLEHGYERVREAQSHQCFEWATAICEALLGPSIIERWREFVMAF